MPAIGSLIGHTDLALQFFQPNGEHGHIRRSNAGNAPGLTESGGTDFGESQLGFFFETVDRRVIEVCGESAVFLTAHPLDLGMLATLRLRRQVQAALQDRT